MLAAARRFVSDHRARGVTKVFYVERLEGQDFMWASREELEAVSCKRVQDGQLRPYSLKLGCECKFCLSQRAIGRGRGGGLQRQYPNEPNSSLQMLITAVEIYKIIQLFGDSAVPHRDLSNYVG